MLTHPTIDQMRALKLDGMADAFVAALERRKLWPGNAAELVRVAGDMALTASAGKDKASARASCAR